LRNLAFARTLALVGAIACAAALGPALAAEPKPDFSIKTRSIEARVILDAKIKADPALAANCLAEGKAWAKKNRADADKEHKQEPELFRNGPWTMERKYETVVANARQSASSGPTMNILAARIPTIRPTRSCGTGQRANASASVRSSPKQPTTVRR
jgi:hypothetical protein